MLLWKQQWVMLLVIKGRMSHTVCTNHVRLSNHVYISVSRTFIRIFYKLLYETLISCSKCMPYMLLGLIWSCFRWTMIPICKIIRLALGNRTVNQTLQLADSIIWRHWRHQISYDATGMNLWMKNCNLWTTPVTPVPKHIHYRVSTKKDTVTLSHNFRLNYQGSKFQAGM